MQHFIVTSEWTPNKEHFTKFILRAKNVIEARQIVLKSPEIIKVISVEPIDESEIL